MAKVKCLLISLFFIVSNSWASTVNLDLTGGVARWDNAISTSGDYMVPSFWTPTQGLTPTDRWIPGGFTGTPPNKITLYGGNAEVSLPISFIGFEYHTGSALPTVGALAGGADCSVWTPPIATVQGTGCLFSNILTTGSRVVTPYAFIRPIFSVTDADLAESFDKQPGGLYTGSVSLSQFYQFYLGEVKTQFIDSQPFVLQINHTPAYLTDVTIVGEEEMTTVYGIGTNDVSASTSFVVTATGFFSNGINVSLQDANGSYQLTGPDSSTIPYSIECVGCSKDIFVNEGKVENSTITVSAKDTDSIIFSVAVGFDSISLDPLTVGEYSDTFTLIFAPDI